MGPRAALIVSCLALAGCLGDTASPNDASFAVDMAAFGVNDMGSLGCSVPITVTPRSDTLPVTLDAVASMADGAVMPVWQVRYPGDAPATPMTTGNSNQNVSYQATKPGTYTFEFRATINGRSCFGTADYLVHNPNGALVRYRMRALPPESLGVPLTDRVLPLYGREMRDDVNIALDSGTPISGTLRGPGNAALAGEIRFIAGDGPDAVATSSSTGSFTLAVSSDITYQPLLIPQLTTLAPHLGTSDKGVNFAGQSFTVGAGESVTGSVVDDKAAGIANARVVLRAGALPSGVGVTGGNGAFTLRAEQQSYALSVGSDEWPIATAGNVAVPAGGVAITVAYTVARVAVTGSLVTRADGTTPVAGARVTITSRPLGNVATVKVGAAAALAATGRVLRQVVSDASGHLPSLQLPPGTYDLIVEPPAGTTPEGLTTITRTLAGPDSWTLPLHARTTLSGKISDGSGNGVAAVTVRAVELAGLGAAPTTTSLGDGSYSLTVDSGAAILLVFEPPGGVGLAGVKQSLAAGTTRFDVTLQKGLYISGKVLGTAGGGVASVLVEALCYDCGSNAPITSGVTDKDGKYVIYLPDPGDIIVDGGSD